MIATLCANPCIDKTVFVGKFEYGATNKVLGIRREGCGKGVTVAIASALLGLDAACVCLLPEEGSALLAESVGKGGIAAEYIPCPGALRVNTKVLDGSRGAITEFNEGGPEVGPDIVRRFHDAALRLAASSDYLVLTGSAPPGFPDGFYGSVIAEAKGAAPRCKTVLDAEGRRLAEGLKAGPAVVKPNRYELELLCGRKLGSLGEILREAVKLIDGGAELAAVSLGADGACLTDGREAYFSPALKVEVRSTLGAGDSMLAGMLFGLAKRRTPEDVLRFGMAAAAASVATDGTGLTDRSLFDHFVPMAEIRKIPV
jgi:1-phosphofructokinase